MKICTQLFIAALFVIAKNWNLMVEVMAQAVQHLLCKNEALSSNPNQKKKKHRI
jgi:hypothetical protein